MLVQFVLRPSPKSGSGEAPLEDIDRYLTSFRVGACSFLLALRIFKKNYRRYQCVCVCARVCAHHLQTKGQGIVRCNTWEVHGSSSVNVILVEPTRNIIKAELYVDYIVIQDLRNISNCWLRWGLLHLRNAQGSCGQFLFQLQHVQRLEGQKRHV